MPQTPPPQSMAQEVAPTSFQQLQSQVEQPRRMPRGLEDWKIVTSRCDGKPMYYKEIMGWGLTARPLLNSQTGKPDPWAAPFKMETTTVQGPNYGVDLQALAQTPSQFETNSPALESVFLESKAVTSQATSPAGWPWSKPKTSLGDYLIPVAIVAGALILAVLLRRRNPDF